MRDTFYRAWSIAILSVSVLIFCVTLFLVLGQNSKPKVVLAVSPETAETNIGKTFSVGVYFRGPDAGGINAADIRLKFDTQKVKLISALVGPYFNQPLQPIWKVEEGRFAVAANPAIGQPENAELSVLRLEFKALAKGKTELTFEANSKGYVSDKGGLVLTGNKGIVKIN